MLRQFVNVIKGRQKSTNESPSLQETLELLSGLNGNTRGSIHYQSGFTSINLRGVAPRDMVSFVRDKFHDRKGYYSNVKHQVYSGRKDEKHYLELTFGEIAGEFGARIIEERPFQRASINFVVEKQD